MKGKIAIIIIFVQIVISCTIFEVYNFSDVVFRTKGNIQGPVKTINARYNDVVYSYNNGGNVELKTEYFTNGKICSEQFFEMNNNQVFIITVRYFYDMNTLSSIEYYRDGEKIMFSDIFTSRKKYKTFYLSQNINKSILANYIVDYEGRYLFDLMPSWGKSKYCYHITSNKNGWEISVFDEDKTEIYFIKCEESARSNNRCYFIKDCVFELYNKLELEFVEHNLVQLKLYNIENFDKVATGNLMVQKKYEYTRFDKYGNWIECNEETLGIKRNISREILYYEN